MNEPNLTLFWVWWFSCGAVAVIGFILVAIALWPKKKR